MSDQRIVLVTRGNKGIGYEAVKILSQKIPHGTILLASRSVANGEAATEKLKQSVPSHTFGNVHVVPLDISDPSTIDKAVELVKARFGRLDVLINNAAIANINGPLDSPEIFDVNIRGTRNVTEAFLPLIAANSGLVVNVSSELASYYTHDLPESTRALLLDEDHATWEMVERWMADWLEFSQKGKSDIEWKPLDDAFAHGYTVSKAILAAWSRGFAKAHPEIKVALVCPGYCATDLNNNSGPRKPSEGGESIVWPVFNEFENGRFYSDGKLVGWAHPMPDWLKQQ